MPEDREFWGWLDGYLTGIIGIAVLGGQITFTVLVSDIADPAEAVGPRSPTFRKDTVRAFIGVSWLLFTTLMGIAVFVKILVSDPRERSWLLQRRLGTCGFRALYSVFTLLLNALSIVPFLFLALAATAYVPVVGWLGTALVSFYTLVVGVAWLLLDSGGIWS